MKMLSLKWKQRWFACSRYLPLYPTNPAPTAKPNTIHPINVSEGFLTFAAPISVRQLTYSLYIYTPTPLHLETAQCPTYQIHHPSHQQHQSPTHPRRLDCCLKYTDSIQCGHSQRNMDRSCHGGLLLGSGLWHRHARRKFSMGRLRSIYTILHISIAIFPLWLNPFLFVLFFFFFGSKNGE